MPPKTGSHTFLHHHPCSSLALSASFFLHPAVSLHFSHACLSVSQQHALSFTLAIPPSLHLSRRSAVICSDVSGELIIPSSCCLPTTTLFPSCVTVAPFPSCLCLSLSLPLSFPSSFTISCLLPSPALSSLPLHLHSHPLSYFPEHRHVMKIHPLVHKQSDAVPSDCCTICWVLICICMRESQRKREGSPTCPLDVNQARPGLDLSLRYESSQIMKNKGISFASIQVNNDNQRKVKKKN